MFSWCGYKIHKSARLVSSIQIYGNLKLAVGKDTYVGQDVIIAGGECSIEIGDYCDIGPRVCILGGTHEVNMNEGHTAGKGYSKDIKIKDGAWIGANSTILCGVTIGKKSIVAAGSVISKDVAPYTIVTTKETVRIIPLPKSGTFIL
jgi:acetyltransferase-like isoleucine patch superfamily enzyme